MAKSILGQQLTSAFSPDGTGAPVVPTAAAQAQSTLHDVTSANNNPPLPYKGPYPFKFQNPLIDSELDFDEAGEIKYVDNLPR